MTEKYQTYTLADFIQDDAFIEWAKSPDAAGDAFWQQIAALYPHQKEVIAQARQTILNLAELSRPAFDEQEAGLIWAQISGQMDEMPVPARAFRPSWLRYAAAAVVVLMTAWGIRHWYRGPETLYAQRTGQIENVREEINETRAEKIVRLPDGSQVTLAQGSRISFSESMDGTRREVYLSGEAFFDVKRNPSKPFLVYAGELTTRVLGTSFTVRSFEEENVASVQVRTGSVSVEARAPRKTQSVVLSPNQQVSFFRKEERLSMGLVKAPQPVIPQAELARFTFNNAPVSTIFDSLSKAYGIEIVYDKEAVAACRLTSSVQEESLYEILGVICEAIEADYQVTGAKIRISDPHCN
ncbi:MAG: FecR domain-containing protein [Dyadobacter sp.]|uniref:FecR family protein n=1 Tax=Dyadobacter sp. TaxID=1914288 RepID=UPI001B2AA003|nr:FecR domain-containing protein [Dyadobacter sp.]MBO9613098.1 FecR domain-containing protein [Dyadobacter sp.]